MNLNRLRALVDKKRRIATPIRTTSVTIRKRAWPQTLGIGSPTITDLKLISYVKAQFVKSNEIATSGGELSMGDVVISQITPKYPGGGYAIDDIAPEPADSLTEIIYVLNGDLTGEYRLVSAQTDKPFEYLLTVRNRNNTP